MLPLFLLLCLSVEGTIFDVTSYGAVGDGVTDDTHSIAAALVVASKSSPSTVLFPAHKTFLTGPLNMSSNMTLHVEGTIRGITGNNTAKGIAGWPQIPPLPSYGDSRDGPYLQYQALVFARDATNIAITGTGTIDGQGEWWWTNKRNRSAVISGRPNLIQFINCTTVEVSGVTLRDSPFWCLHPVQCTDVYVHHIKIRSRMYAPNSDGIDPDSSRNVMIEYNDVSTGDDGIAIKAGVCGASSPNDCHDPKFTQGDYRTENVTVRYNTFRVGMGISVGSESSGGIRNVEIYDNVVGLCQQGSGPGGCGWGPAMHVKTALTRGGVMENIMFRNNTVYNNSGFINMQTNYQSGDKGPKDYPATKVRNISFIGNRALGGGVGAGFICSVHDVCEGLTIINNTIDSKQSTWGCHFIHTYNVSGNSPSGLSDCMEKSMNRTLTTREHAYDNAEEARQSAFLTI